MASVLVGGAVAVAATPAPPRSGAADIMEFTTERLDALLGRSRAYAIGLVSNWLIRRARARALPAETITLLCERLVALGLPLDRYSSSTELLDSEHDAVTRLWRGGQGVSERSYVRDEDNTAYLTSPFHEAAETGRTVEMWLPETDDTRFDIVADLKADGFTHYLCVPFDLMIGGHGWVTFATRKVEGFTRVDVAALARLLPSIALLIDVRSTWVSLDRLLRTYVGDEPHRAILRGNTKRGQVSTIRSAILVADMRDSVDRTVDLAAVEAVDLFNAFFDCLVPPIEARGGEVLKYMGDGLLAIFRNRKDGGDGEADRSLAAARSALDMLRMHNVARAGERPIQAGFALHYGETAYGNVGSGVRLDFTVIGKDVALASRIAGMNRGLNEPILMSKAFAERLSGGAARVGAYDVRGFADAIEIFRPKPVDA